MGGYMQVLEINNISKRFGDLTAVDNLSFTLEAGNVFGFLGPNGAGKTTTIRMIMNIIVPDSGSISVMGNSRIEEINNQIGYLPEERGIYRKMKVKEVLLFLAQLKEMRYSEASKAIDHWLERMSLSDWKKKKVEELSKGMQQKLQFIATILFDPSLIILDEPFMGLDPINVNIIKDVIMEMKKKGKTIIFSTHSMDSAEKLCDRILLLNKGKEVLSGKLSEVKQRYGKKNIHLNYEGDDNYLRESELVEKFDDFGNFMEIQLKPEVDPQEFLKQVSNRYRVSKFEIVEPSLNDIFIQTVSSTNRGDDA
jgi:ABC-2 type transport system ATP-binding protein